MGMMQLKRSTFVLSLLAALVVGGMVAGFAWERTGRREFR